MKKLVFTLIAMSLAFGNKIQEMSVTIYPEYYYPGVMVEYTGVFSSVSPSESISFMTPFETDSIFQIIENDNGGTDLNMVEPDKSGEETWVGVSMAKKDFRLFAFFTPYDPSNPHRDFEFNLKFDEAVENLHIVVNQPASSNGFEMDKQGSEPFSDQHGLNFNRFHISQLEANSMYSIRIAYENPSLKTTMAYLQEMLASGGERPSTASPHDIKTVPQRHRLPLWEPLAVLFTLAIIVSVVYVKSKDKSEGPKSTPAKQSSIAAFCSQCGSRLQDNAKFCHSCGAKI